LLRQVVIARHQRRIAHHQHAFVVGPFDQLEAGGALERITERERWGWNAVRMSPCRSPPSQHVGLSPAPCWRRIKRLEDEDVIVRRVALVDRRKVNVPMTVFVAVKAPRHAAEWLNAFRRMIADVATSVSVASPCFEMTRV
jgi:hypothetical protein